MLFDEKIYSNGALLEDVQKDHGIKSCPLYDTKFTQGPVFFVSEYNLFSRNIFL